MEMSESFRIVVLGDFHIKDYAETKRAVEDVSNCRPDLVVPLGDFGSGDKIGSPAGLEEAYAFLKTVGAPIRPILGNHDLQRESGGGPQAPGTMTNRLLALFNLDKPYGAVEKEEFRLFFLSTDYQKPEICYQVQEVFISDAQFNWVVAKLKERPGVPAIFFSHAPPVGCGLRTVPSVHVRATNAYLDQNHNPLRWLELIKSFPEIVCWFSAHYHLGHGLPDTASFRYGTYFFNTGVHSSAARDSSRVSRVVDLSSNSLKVHTLDHEKRGLTEEGSWRWNKPLRELFMVTKENKLQEGSLTCLAKCFVGEGQLLAHGLVCLNRDRFLVATEDGYVWEAEPALECVWGTLHLGEPVNSLALSTDGIWLAWGKTILRVDPKDPWRFVRQKAGRKGKEGDELPLQIDCLAPRQGGGVWIAACDTLWQASAKKSPLKLLQLPERMKRLTADGKYLWLHGSSGKLWRLTCDNFEVSQVKQEVMACDEWRGDRVELIEEKDRLRLLYYSNGKLGWQRDFEKKENTRQCQVLCLGAERALFNYYGQVIFCDGRSNKVLETDAHAVAFTRVEPESKHKNPNEFCLAFAASNEKAFPQLQVWSCCSLSLS